MFGLGQPEASVTVQVPWDVQHEPPHGLLGAQDVTTPWNAPEQPPGAVIEQLPEGSQHAPTVGSSTITV